MKRREFITLLGGAAAAWPLAARAQQSTTAMVGFLHSGSPEPNVNFVAGFRKGLSETGYVDGQNVTIEFRWAEGRDDRLAELAADLIRRGAAVIATPASTPAALAAKAATTTIPIVFTTGGDPVALGLVASLNRPGGNVTGITFMTVELTAKRLGLLHDLVPSARRFAALVNPNSPFLESIRKDLQSAALNLGLQVETLYGGTNREIDATLTKFAQEPGGALLMTPDAFFTNRRVQLVTLAARYAMPAIFPIREFTEVGGLMSYGPNFADAFRQAGIYTGRILRGEKPADLPVTQPTTFEFVINLQTARLLGIAVAPTLLALADEVIE
jgi:putative tryptophan/tyrosine transport system substrate-binding protein